MIHVDLTMLPSSFSSPSPHSHTSALEPAPPPRRHHPKGGAAPVIEETRSSNAVINLFYLSKKHRAHFRVRSLAGHHGPGHVGRRRTSRAGSPTCR